MELVHTAADLQQIISNVKVLGKSVGFVPTMGALHPGHLSLVEQAGSSSDYVVVSIFVNPTQFNDKGDLEKYPRNLEQDLMLLKNTPCNLVFAPGVNEMYPEEDTRVFDFGAMGEVMEGKHRPGHFNGVAQVVSKLFDMVQPHKAFFGEKDFQQLAIIKAMAKQLNYEVEIVPCATVREPDGLAMSSRNQRLASGQRKSAALISRTLFEAVGKKNIYTVEELKNRVVKNIDSDENLETEYFEIVDSESLQAIGSWEEKVNKRGCIAVYCGEVRLIDNVTF
jgi:pantoate--beta-alanine ligase